ncbi:MAG: 16S rRNA (guanine(966)-N(2))-methyltransferase RsmD [Clostridia bacterium]|nr:16S rRNA (guanine(966)-N(2))-methyltransferase RsmD [Clostridia bacterium]
MRVISGTARGTKLNSIDEMSTRPTLDRVKESLFNIIQQRIDESVVLDLFAGSGAIGIEFLSRGCRTAYLCDKASNAVNMINQNLQRTRLSENAVVMNKDYKKCLQDFSNNNITFDIIFIDPPYKDDIAVSAVEMILSLKLLNEDGIIIIETDEKDREIQNLKKLDIQIYDCRKYGRANLIFLN